MSLFTPKWRNPRSSKEEATAAVYHIKDQDTLKKAAVSASWRQARIAAISRITDENFLYGLAQSAKEDIEVTQAAVNNIRSQGLLLKLSYLSNSVAASAAIVRITDSGLLVQALNSPNTYVRYYALGKLDDQRLFKKYAVSDPDQHNRLDAFDHISDLEYKKELVLNEDDDHMLENLLHRFKLKIVEDQNFCKMIYNKISKSEESFPMSYPIIIRCLKDDHILRDLALQGKTLTIRHAAARGVENEEIIAEIIMKADLEMTVKQDLYFSMERRELVDSKIREEIEYRDYRFWSEQDKRLADRMAADSY